MTQSGKCDVSESLSISELEPMMMQQMWEYNKCNEHKQLMWLCNKCETGSNKCVGCNKCEQVQQMRTGATNADRCNDCERGLQQMWNRRQWMHKMQQMQTGGRCNKCNNRCNRCFTKCNKCSNECDDRCNGCDYGAMNAQSGVHKLCLMVQHVGDSDTNWQQQGALSRAHNLL